jgi:hypothetical protein
MKKVFWIITALALTAVSSTDVTAQVRLGIRGGVSLATVGGDEVDNVSSRTGINVGATLLFPLGGNLGLQVGAGIADKGATLDIDAVEATVKLTYIEVPVLLHLAIPTEGSFTPHLVAGTALSFQMGCDIDGSAGDLNVSAPCDETELDVNSFDVGLMGGAGVDIATSTELTITLDALYNYGLSTIDGSEDPSDVKNRAWSFLAGVAFPL